MERDKEERKAKDKERNRQYYLKNKKDILAQQRSRRIQGPKHRDMATAIRMYEQGAGFWRIFEQSGYDKFAIHDVIKALPKRKRDIALSKRSNSLSEIRKKRLENHKQAASVWSERKKQASSFTPTIMNTPDYSNENIPPMREPLYRSLVW